MLDAPYQSRPPLGAPIDWTRPASAGLVGLWALGEGSGLPVDSVGQWQATANTGVWTPSPIGPALSYNGTSQWTNLGVVPAINVSGPITIALFASPSTVGACNAIDNHNPPANTLGWMAGFNLGGSGGVGLYIGTNNASVNLPGANDGNWHVYAFSQSSTATGGIQFYRDGKLMGTGTNAAFPTPNTGNASLGARVDGAARWMSGPIGWAAVWSRALSAVEHAAIGAGPSAIFGLTFGSPRSAWLTGTARVAAPAGVIHYLRRRRRTA